MNKSGYCDTSGGTTLADHITALRSALLKMIVATLIILPAGYWASDHVIDFLVRWSIPETLGQLHYFTPMEVFIVRLKMAFILSLIAAYPWNIYQLWSFLLPALYQSERKALSCVLFFSSLLFFAGAAFCVFLILPMIMEFSASFADSGVRPLLGLKSFLELASWMMLAFGLMFQTPVLLLPAVKFGLVSVATLKKFRPYIIVIILIAAAILTPPDIISQLMLAIPTWLLFETGLLLAGRIDKNNET